MLQQPSKAVDANSMVTLWDLLTAVCYAMPIAGALASAKLAKAGFSGYALAIIVGFALGLSFGWIMRTVGKVVAAHLKGLLASSREWYARALYFAAARCGYYLAFFLETGCHRRQ